MVAGRTVGVSLRLRVGADPIEGSLQVDDGPSAPFRGWLQLTALLGAAAEPDGAVAAEPTDA